MAKKVTNLLKLQIPAGGANPSPPVGPALGQAGLNIMDFCNAFNNETQEAEKGIPLPVVINVYEDKSFDFILTSMSSLSIWDPSVKSVTFKVSINL